MLNFQSTATQRWRCTAYLENSASGPSSSNNISNWRSSKLTAATGSGPDLASLSSSESVSQKLSLSLSFGELADPLSSSELGKLDELGDHGGGQTNMYNDGPGWEIYRYAPRLTAAAQPRGVQSKFRNKDSRLLPQHKQCSSSRLMSLVLLLLQGGVGAVGAGSAATSFAADAAAAEFVAR